MKNYIKFLPLLLICIATSAHAMKVSMVIVENSKAMEKMHEDMMAVEPTPIADEAFVRGMIPHHQGAVDMAIIELKYGKDPELRKMAQEIIDSQKKEIEFMKQWQAKNDNNNGN